MFGEPGRGDRIARIVGVPLLIVFVLVTAVFYVIFSHLVVVGHSMLPALRDTDRVLITRGYDTPQVGDIVVVRVTSPHTGEVEDFIKRVVAVEGDTVSVVSGIAYVNGARESAVYEVLTSDEDVTTPEVLVPSGSIYVLGDNRPASFDSRFYGPVPLSAAVGRVVAIYAPLDRIGTVD